MSASNEGRGPVPVSGEVIESGSVQIRADGLLSKYGFEDGDVLDDLLADAGFDPVEELGQRDGWSVLLGAEVLEAVVRRKFGGHLPREAIVGGMSNSHNPVRLAVRYETPETVRMLEALAEWVSPSEVAEVAHEVYERFGRKRSPVVGGPVGG